MFVVVCQAATETSESCDSGLAGPVQAQHAQEDAASGATRPKFKPQRSCAGL